MTSPPYPMIEMWDEMFCEQCPAIKDALRSGDGRLAFELMHQILDKVWAESFRVLKPGGLICINIGDATRTIGGQFQLYSNHSRILAKCSNLGLSILPSIIWRKHTNAPNKFMGSGMLPSGAYVTLEHEHILVMRKGSRREFKTDEEKLLRYESAYFWEERNKWFSDIWFNLNGVNQTLNNSKSRSRSGAFPFELAYRLISMYSVKGDTVLDPFMGIATTALAAIASYRNSIGVEIDAQLKPIIVDKLTNHAARKCNEYIYKRTDEHANYVKERIKAKGTECFKYENETHGFPVMTRQETKIALNPVKSCTQVTDDLVEVAYGNCLRSTGVK